MSSARALRMFGTLDNLRDVFKRLSRPQWQRVVVASCHGKLKFVSRKEAIDHRDKTQRYRWRKTKLQTYKCAVCDHFHLAQPHKGD